MNIFAAVAVSGGADSTALCILASLWKRDDKNIASRSSTEFVDGLLAIVVDHGLRPESKDEAKLVHDRVTNMGMDKFSSIGGFGLETSLMDRTYIM